jgi:hypothetical protein
MRRKTPGKNNRSARKFAAWSLIATISFTSIAGYVALSITLNGPPPYLNFDGMAFLLQPASESKIEKVQLLVDSSGGDSHPFVSYSISACGPRPYSADLVLTGNAQVTDDLPSPPFTRSSPIRRFLGGLSFIRNNLRSDYPLGSVQLIRFDLPKAPCQEGAPPVTRLIQGSMLGSLQQSWSGPWGLWHGPHASQSWPQIGFPADPTGGPFTLLAMSSSGVLSPAGNWALPGSLNIEVTQEYVAPGWSIDSSSPSTSMPGRLSWLGTNLIYSPSAQLTDTASVALLQDWIVVCAIGFGIGGAMLASLLFEWIRPRGPQGNTSDERLLRSSSESTGRLRQPDRMKHGITTRLFLLGLTLAVGYARRHQRGHKP